MRARPRGCGATFRPAFGDLSAVSGQPLQQQHRRDACCILLLLPLPQPDFSACRCPPRPQIRPKPSLLDSFSLFHRSPAHTADLVNFSAAKLAASLGVSLRGGGCWTGLLNNHHNRVLLCQRVSYRWSGSMIDGRGLARRLDSPRRDRWALPPSTA